ncbi:MAG: molybdopterin cofactor-binding domain-containing protein [Saprospiraceae bacterium]|nr:molybdopterin cofactor-binding domain-containing protein [Saprospiraceae bacterium]
MISNDVNKIDRRSFLKFSGSITFVISAGLAYPLYSFFRKEEQENIPINAWVQISPDDKVTIYNPAAEMGQGSRTALPIILAEEMDADWAKVIIKDSPIDAAVYGHDGWGSRPMMAIVGSYAVEGYYKNLRLAGTQVRQILKTIASNHWKVPLTELSTEANKVIHQPTGKRLSYGDIVALGQMPSVLPEVSPELLKNPKDFKIIGTDIARRDIPEKVNGKAVYSIDIILPGMAYAAIERSPVLGSKPVLLNEQEIMNLPGVLDIVILDHGIVVIADDIEAAFYARQRLSIQWSDVPAIEYNSEESLHEYASLLNDPSYDITEVFTVGDVKNQNSIIKTFTSDYLNDYVYHAQMEPLNAVVALSEDRTSAEIWVGTQAPDTALRDAAKTLGIEASKIILHRCYLGGGFGRRARRDYLIDACLIARQSKINRPIKLIWRRENDLSSGMFRPKSLQRLTAGMDTNGNLITWEHKIIGPGRGLLHTGINIPFYNIPNQKMEVKYIDHSVQTCSWRAEGHSQNKFAIEAFMDEIATNVNIDPLTFRRRLLKDNPRALHVLNTVAKMANWDSNTPTGKGRGLSFCERSAITACVCEISLNQNTGKIKVHKVWMAVDAGLVVQPKNAITQIEGGIIMAISAAMLERISIKNGKVEQSNFHDYSILRYADVPETIEIELIRSLEKPVGIGEASLPGVGGAIANAFAALTGKRLYRMPFTPDRVKKVLDT